MRIKFKKGLPPEAIAATFLDILKGRNAIIGAVNIYIQEYGDDMKVVPFSEECIEVSPTSEGLRRYTEYSANLRRSNLRAI